MTNALSLLKQATSKMINPWYILTRYRFWFVYLFVCLFICLFFRLLDCLFLCSNIFNTFTAIHNSINGCSCYWTCHSIFSDIPSPFSNNEASVKSFKKPFCIFDQSFAYNSWISFWSGNISIIDRHLQVQCWETSATFPRPLSTKYH